jgi:hypothetical protein
MKTRGFLILAAIVILSITSVSVSADPLPYPAKWSQLPDMNQGTDWLSMHRANGTVVVDDFRSTGSPIVGFHWWGSYFNSDPNLQPGQQRQVSFEVSLHPDVPAVPPQFSTPGQPYQFQIVNAQETFFGITAGGQNVYEYWAKLIIPWSETAGTIYWSDIAWAAGQFGTDPLANIWGWHESFQHWNDSAVTTLVVGAGGNPHTGTWALVGGGGHDMAFEVLTTPEPGTILLVGAGLTGLGLLRWRSRKQD